MSNPSGWTTFFTSEHVPRWQVIAVGVIAFLASFGVNEHYYQRALNDDRAQAEQARVQSTLLDLQRHSIDFQTFAGAFVSKVLEDSEDIEEARDALVANILAQDAAVDLSLISLGGDARPAIMAYRQALREMIVAIETVSDIDSMGQFWQAATNLLVARNALLEFIEQQASPIAGV